MKTVIVLAVLLCGTMAIAGPFGQSISDSSISAATIGAVWQVDTCQYIQRKPHDTTFEKIVAIKRVCDTVINRSQSFPAPGYDEHFIIYRTEINCRPDTTWGPRDDLKLTKEDIALLLKFLRGQWSPPQNHWGIYHSVLPYIQTISDTLKIQNFGGLGL